MSDNTKELAIKKKCEKDFPEFAEMCANADSDSLQKQLARLANYKEETELALKKDEDVERAKETLGELKAPYQDSIKALKVKISYLHVVLTEKGYGNVEKTETAV